jgi:hypothetical protein
MLAHKVLLRGGDLLLPGGIKFKKGENLPHDRPVGGFSHDTKANSKRLTLNLAT